MSTLDSRPAGTVLGHEALAMNDTMTIQDIAARLGASVRTVRDRWVHDPTFPPPALRPSRCKRQWKAEDVLAWAAKGDKSKM
jgi:hypothetical protein